MLLSVSAANQPKSVMHHLFNKNRLIASIFVVVLLLVLVMKSGAVSWDRVLSSLQGIGTVNLLLALCMALIQYLCLSLRFVVLLPEAEVRKLRICRIFVNGQLINHLLPARAGDLYKVLAVKRASSRPDFSTAYVVSAVVIERLLAALVLLALVVVMVDWTVVDVRDLPFSDSGRRFELGLLVVLITGLALYYVQTKLPRLRRWLQELKRSFLTILDLRRFLLAAGLSVVVWTAEEMAMKLLAAPLAVEIELGQGMLILLLLNIGIAVPVTLANIGIYEAALVLGMGLWGIGTNQAIAIALSHHALQLLALVVWIVIFGIVEKRREHGRI